MLAPRRAFMCPIHQGIRPPAAAVQRTEGRPEPRGIAAGLPVTYANNEREPLAPIGLEAANKDQCARFLMLSLSKVPFNREDPDRGH